MNQDVTLVNVFPVQPLRVNGFLQRYQKYVWYQYNISLAYNRLVGPFQSGTTVRNNLKDPNMIENKQWKELEKEGKNKGINTSGTKEVAPLEQ